MLTKLLNDWRLLVTKAPILTTTGLVLAVIVGAVLGGVTWTP